MKLKLGLTELCRLCRLICEHEFHHPNRRVSVTLVGAGLVSVTLKGDFMATVIKTGGPFKFDVGDFVADSGNPVTDKDPAVYSSSDENIATVVNDPADPQDGVVTLTGNETAEGATCVIKATFPAQRGGKSFDVVGDFIVIPEPAASARAVITGPGLVEGA